MHSAPRGFAVCEDYTSQIANKSNFLLLLIRASLGMSLYKYVPSERLDILRNLRIRFTQPGAQNDLFELRPPVNRFRKPEVARQTLSAPFSEEWDRQFSDKILKQFGLPFVNEIERMLPGYLDSQKEAALLPRPTSKAIRPRGKR